VKRFLAAALFACSLPAGAVDSVSAEYGAGTRDVNLWRIGVQWKAPPFEWMQRHDRWSWYWDASMGGWHGDEGTVHDVGVTPVFRYMKVSHGIYLEGGIGAHLLSDSHINSDLGFSTRFQFGDMWAPASTAASGTGSCAFSTCPMAACGIPTRGSISSSCGSSTT